MIYFIFFTLSRCVLVFCTLFMEGLWCLLVESKMSFVSFFNGDGTEFKA